MRLLILIPILLLLAACQTPARVVVVEKEYVVRQAVSAQKELPPYPAPIDVQTATQIELAEWLAASEERQWRLESIISELIKFYEAPVSEAEKKALDTKKGE